MASYFHGIYANEVPTSLIAPTQIESGIAVVIGTAPTHLARNPASVNKPVLAYKYSEAVDQLGYSDDFETYTLCGAMKVFFSLYNIAPVVFINVLDATKHYKEVETEFSGVSSSAPKIEGQIDVSSITATSGIYVASNTLVKDRDFVADTMTLEGEDVKAVEIIDLSKLIDNKARLTYRKASEALGGEETVVNWTIDPEDPIYIFPDNDVVFESISIVTGGVGNTFQNLIEDVDFSVSYANGVATISILNESKITDDKIKVTYHELDPSAVTAADVIGGVDLATGKTTGIELIESVHPMFGIIPGTLIAPKFSLDAGVTAALVAKAKKVSGIFPAMAITDLDTTAAKTYTAAVENKNSLNLSDENLIACYPMVKNGGDIYYLSTHLAALMAQVDYDNGGIPYVSPSNKSLQIDAAVLEDGTEIFLTRDQANLLNENGIVTALSFSGWKAWGNYTSVYPASSDVKEIYIPVRRMFNFLTNTFLTNYISRLDMPVTRRLVDSVLNSANIYLNGLVTKGALLGGRLEFAADENTVTDLMNGSLTFHLYITPPVPAQTIIFTLEYDVNYLAALLS